MSKITKNDLQKVLKKYHIKNDEVIKNTDNKIDNLSKEIVGSINEVLNKSVAYKRMPTNVTNLYEMTENGVYLTHSSGITDLPDGWVQGRHILVTFYNENLDYSAQIIMPYKPATNTEKKMAFRICLRENSVWQEVTTKREFSNLSNPNLLINGDFQIWQRATSFTFISPPIITADRWRTLSNLANSYTVEKATDGLKVINKLDASHTFNIGQGIEWREEFSGKTATLSYSINGVISKRIITMTKNAKGNYMHVNFNVSIPQGIGSSVTINWIKLELGSVATPFVPKSYAEELMDCQRYYYTYQFRSRAYWINSNSVFSSEPCPIMRTIPTICLSDARIGRVNGQWETDFSFKGSCENLGNIIIEATKSSHNLTDAYIRSFVVADAEIY